MCGVNSNESYVIRYAINVNSESSNVNTMVQMLTPIVIVNEVNYNDPNVNHYALNVNH